MPADLVIGAVLLAGRRAPVVLKQSVVKKMNPGSVIVDIAIDQGGCVEDIHSTSSEQLCYIKNGVIHSAVPNMPATVSRTSSLNALAAADESSSLAQALVDARAIHQGKVVDEVLNLDISAHG